MGPIPLQHAELPLVMSAVLFGAIAPAQLKNAGGAGAQEALHLVLGAGRQPADAMALRVAHLERREVQVEAW